jgi:hypothetical protein
MLLRFEDRKPFATGRLAYNRVRGSGLSTRIVLEIDIGDQLTTGFLDTGMPCVVCSPEYSTVVMGLSPADGIREEVRIRGRLMWGTIHSVNAAFPFDEGAPLLLGGVIVFVPDNLEEVGEDLRERSFIGMLACLDTMRFAIDPRDTMFYFAAG